MPSTCLGLLLFCFSFGKGESEGGGGGGGGGGREGNCRVVPVRNEKNIKTFFFLFLLLNSYQNLS